MTRLAQSIAKVIGETGTCALFAKLSIAKKAIGKVTSHQVTTLRPRTCSAPGTRTLPPTSLDLLVHTTPMTKKIDHARSRKTVSIFHLAMTTIVQPPPKQPFHLHMLPVKRLPLRNAESKLALLGTTLLRANDFSTLQRRKVAMNANVLLQRIQTITLPTKVSAARTKSVPMSWIIALITPTAQLELPIPPTSPYVIHPRSNVI